MEFESWNCYFFHEDLLLSTFEEKKGKRLLVAYLIRGLVISRRDENNECKELK